MPAALPKTVLATLTVAALTAMAGCGSSSSSSNGAGDATSASKDGVTQVALTLASDGGGDACEVDHDSVPAGPITFTVSNKSAPGITEVELQNDQKIVAEKENLAPGLAPVKFTSTLGGGKYQFYCPGATKELIDFTVTGKAAPTPAGSAAQLLQSGTAGYGKYVTTQVDAMIVAVKQLQTDVDAGNLDAAQKQYGVARPFYEKIESDVDGFVLPGFKPTDNHGNLDYLIDMRASNLDPAVGWHGFHAVERDLFGSKKITPSTKKLAAELTSNVNKLAHLSKSLTYKPEDLANGAAGLLEEVQTNKVSGEEEAFSHIDLVDFAGNVEGAEQSFAYLKPGLTKIDPAITQTISQRFDAVNTMLNGYRDPSAIGGYKIYTAQLKKTDANKLSQTVQALQDSLANLAEKVATAQ
jgi:iron uptake system component EfeO